MLNHTDIHFWHPMLVRPVMKRLFFLKAKNGLGRFALSALPHYKVNCLFYIEPRIRFYTRRTKFRNEVTNKRGKEGMFLNLKKSCIINGLKIKF